MKPQDINAAITELAGLFDNLNERWKNDTCSTDLYQFYRQKEYKRAFEKLKDINIENIVLEIIANSLNEKILIRLRMLLKNNIQIYDTRQNDFKGIDFYQVYSLHEKQLFENKFALLRKEKEDIQDFPYPTEQERTILLKENQKEKNLLENERSDYTRANVWIVEDYYSKIYQISQSFFAIINSYFPGEKENIIPETDTQALAINDEVNIEIEQPLIEPDMIFRTKMYEKLLSLEQKLIKDKYLSDDLHWISAHENGRADIKRLVTFLTGLIENNYFLPNKDPKIKIFFESRYHIKIGQNFERKRRESLGSEYKAVFYDYPF